MNRLQSELRRLYLPGSSADGRLIDPQGMVRAIVLELARPADWGALSKVWRGVQADLELPVPAIAVSGTEGFQLWFSLAKPASVAQAHEFLALLCARFLPDVAPRRLALMPAVEAFAPQLARHAAAVPAEQGESGNWSAFVAPDLAPVFADTPWLDVPPSEEGQADLLSRLASIQPSAWEAALERLGPLTPVPAAPAARRVDAAPPAAAGSVHAQRFLLGVMNDDAVALALRIEAAKALLPYCDERPRARDT